MEKRNEILKLSFEFALEEIVYCESLEKLKKYVISRQLLKTGTSVGANIPEAQNAHRRKDFIDKCVIDDKEADETEYWLLLYQKSKTYPAPGQLKDTILSIKKLLSKNIACSVKNQMS
jgi:four helix bundle protein